MNVADAALAAPVAASAAAGGAAAAAAATVQTVPPVPSPRVVVRLRPPTTNEDCADVSSSVVGTVGAAASSTSRAVRATDGTTLEVREPGSGALVRRFAVDTAFGEQCKTGELFASIRGLVRRAALGGNSSVIAYGPTGAGKTHTMYGDPREPGLVMLAAAELLNTAAGRAVRVSMLELHNEGLSDLLVPKGVQPDQQAAALEVRGGTGVGSGSMATFVGAREVAGTSVSSILTALRAGLARRQVAATMVNATSSRSHVVVVFRVGTGQLTLMDLAGVERVKRSGAEGSVLREAQSINRTLHSISDVVDALRRGERHIPSRNSRLARLVSGSLGGGAETAVVVCIAPFNAKKDEAVAALCFADRVRRIPSPSVFATGAAGTVSPSERASVGSLSIGSAPTRRAG